MYQAHNPNFKIFKVSFISDDDDGGVKKKRKIGNGDGVQKRNRHQIYEQSMKLFEQNLLKVNFFNPYIGEVFKPHMRDLCSKKAICTVCYSFCDDTYANLNKHIKKKHFKIREDNTPFFAVPISQIEMKSNDKELIFMKEINNVLHFYRKEGCAIAERYMIPVLEEFKTPIKYFLSFHDKKMTINVEMKPEYSLVENYSKFLSKISRVFTFCGKPSICYYQIEEILNEVNTEVDEKAMEECDDENEVEENDDEVDEKTMEECADEDIGGEEQDENDDEEDYESKSVQSSIFD